MRITQPVRWVARALRGQVGGLAAVDVGGSSAGKDSGTLQLRTAASSHSFELTKKAIDRGRRRVTYAVASQKGKV